MSHVLLAGIVAANIAIILGAGWFLSHVIAPHKEHRK